MVLQPQSRTSVSPERIGRPEVTPETAKRAVSCLSGNYNVGHSGLEGSGDEARAQGVAGVGSRVQSDSPDGRLHGLRDKIWVQTLNRASSVADLREDWPGSRTSPVEPRANRDHRARGLALPMRHTDGAALGALILFFAAHSDGDSLIDECHILKCECDDVTPSERGRKAEQQHGPVAHGYVAFAIDGRDDGAKLIDTDGRFLLRLFAPDSLGADEQRRHILSAWRGVSVVSVAVVDRSYVTTYCRYAARLSEQLGDIERHRLGRGRQGIQSARRGPGFEVFPVAGISGDGSRRTYRSGEAQSLRCKYFNVAVCCGAKEHELCHRSRLSKGGNCCGRVAKARLSHHGHAGRPPPNFSIFPVANRPGKFFATKT